jgi:hypothetical protein
MNILTSRLANEDNPESERAIGMSEVGAAAGDSVSLSHFNGAPDTGTLTSDTEKKEDDMGVQALLLLGGVSSRHQQKTVSASTASSLLEDSVSGGSQEAIATLQNRPMLFDVELDPKGNPRPSCSDNNGGNPPEPHGIPAIAPPKRKRMDQESSDGDPTSERQNKTTRIECPQYELLDTITNRVSAMERYQNQSCGYAVATTSTEEDVILLAMVKASLKEMDQEISRLKNRWGGAYLVAEKANKDYAEDPKLRLLFLRSQGFNPGFAAAHLFQFLEAKLSLWGAQRIAETITFPSINAAPRGSPENGSSHLTGLPNGLQSQTPVSTANGPASTCAISAQQPTTTTTVAGPDYKNRKVSTELVSCPNFNRESDELSLGPRQSHCSDGVRCDSVNMISSASSASKLEALPDDRSEAPEIEIIPLGAVTKEDLPQCSQQGTENESLGSPSKEQIAVPIKGASSSHLKSQHPTSLASAGSTLPRSEQGARQDDSAERASCERCQQYPDLGILVEAIVSRASSTSVSAKPTPNDDAPPPTPPITTTKWKSTPSEHDVLLGRGKRAQYHTGNTKMRSLLEEHLGTYSTRGKVNRRSAVLAVVDGVLTKYGGRFLKKTSKNGDWEILPDGSKDVQDKIYHDFRTMRSILKKREALSHDTQQSGSGKSKK